MHTTLQSLRARRARGEDNGFTLIELLVVVVIIGILIAIAIPVYLNYQKGSHDKASESDLRGAISTMEQCYSSVGSYPLDWTPLVGGATGDSATSATCADQKISLSAGTTLTVAASGKGYKMTSTNGDGSGKIYVYDSTVGGAVKVQ
ncbi:MAG: hypothetical protein BGO26_17010 [Actinobacteria bacterium 69-20]|nr:prepilin-type N-terminal cleavage/methylation domain-containing protein [Actinomycetota bacterium]OJV27154.1 MAG: hypothetical protein BGO26_17010 [Actinobacteria bacterium 69-20]